MRAVRGPVGRAITGHSAHRLECLASWATVHANRMGSMLHRKTLRLVSTLLASALAAGVPGVPLAFADDAPTVLVAPYQVIRGSVASEYGPRITDVMADEIHGEDRLILATLKPPAPAAPAQAAAAPPAVAAALAQIEKGEALVKRVRLKPGAALIESGLADYQSFPQHVDVNQLRQAYIMLAVAYSRSGRNEPAGEALDSAIRLAPNARLSGPYPPVFRTAFYAARKRVQRGPKGTVSFTGEGQVWLDGQSQGQAPAQAQAVPLGSHFVRVVRADGSVWGLRLNVATGDNPVAIPAGSGSAPHLAAAAPELAPVIQNELDVDLLSGLAKLAERTHAAYVLFGGIYKAGDNLGVASHLYSARTRGLVALPVIQLDPDLVSAGIEANKVADRVAQVVKAFPRTSEPVPGLVAMALGHTAVAVAATTPKHAPVEKTPATDAKPPDARPIVVKAPESQPTIVVVQQAHDTETDGTEPPSHQAAGGLDTPEPEPVAQGHSHAVVWAVVVGAAAVVAAGVTGYVVYQNNSKPVTGTAQINFQ